MKPVEPHPLTMDASDQGVLRGDPITGERYYCPEFAKQEWQQLWTNIWHVAGRTKELEEPGDYVVHNFMHESVMCVKQSDGSIKAFYNVCQHRGYRLLSADNGYAQDFHCPYHGWVWGLNGVLKDLPDQDDFSQGNPCGKLTLKTLRCDTWGGLIWYTFSDNAPSLYDYLDPLPTLYRNYPMDTAIRVFSRKIKLNCNWKFSTDNFSESYHTRTAHPQVPPWIDQDHWSARREVFPNGHGRTVQPMRPSLRDRLPEGEPHPFDALLQFWGIDPASYPDYETRAMQGWLDLKAAKKQRWQERGYVHYQNMNEEELTDSPHTVIFPNVTLSFLPDNVIFFRSEPDAKDPTKCTFDLWCMAFPVAGQTHVESVMAGVQSMEEADTLERDFDGGRGVPEIIDSIVWQDLMLAEGQQSGWQSQGYADANLAGQEARVRYFHEVLNDYLAGRRPQTNGGDNE